MKQLSLFLIGLIVLTCNTNISIATSFKTNVKFSTTKEESKEATEEPSKILWQGWIRYFHYESYRTIKKPSEFFINQSFFDQRVPKSDLMSKTDNIFNYITQKYNFYGILFPQTLNILSERDKNFAKTIESLDIDVIKPLDPTEPLKGSIKDLGAFNEGSCISVITLIPLRYEKGYLPIKETNNTKNVSWIICFDADTDKEKFFTTLMTYKILKQKEQGIELALRDSAMSKLEPAKTPKFERYTGSDAKPAVDGYLALIQDWTKCTLKCGGGESFQQWRCIPPKTGGKPCMGELIRKQKCNEQPCPGIQVGATESGAKKEEEEEPIVFKPIYRSMPFVQRPQQDIPCEVKENDILYEKEETQYGKTMKVKVPGRILMNTRAVQLFETDSYDKAVFTFNIDQAQLVPVADDHCCFNMRSQNKNFKICALADCGTKNDQKFLNSWKYSFSLFKTKCYRKSKSEKLTEETNLKKEELPDTSSTLSAMNIEADEVGEREKIIEDKLNEDAAVTMEDKVFKTEQTALKAITRELNLEERLKREEMLKAKDETKVLIKKMNHEQEKKEKLDEAIDAKETQETKFMEQRQANKATKTIITETEEAINKKRLALKKKILEIRKMTERRKKLIESKINLIRGKMTEKIVQANKVGNSDTCKKLKDGKQAEIDTYCDDGIINDFSRNKDCKMKENFCYICCETEFGTAQYGSRAKCYDMCDGEKKKAEDQEKPRGDWIWKKYSS